MSITPIQNLLAPNYKLSANPLPSASGTDTFASLLSTAGNGTPFSDDEVKKFFSANPSVQQIADKAVSLGLTKDQMVKAMQVGGYAGGDAATLKAGIDSFVTNSKNTYAWNGYGVLTSNPNSSNGGSSGGALADKVSAATIRAFYATNPTQQQITAKAKELGLSAAQLVQAEVIGEGMDISTVSAHVLESRYVDAAQRLGTDIGSTNGAWTSYFSPTLGRAVTKSEMQAFFNSNPSQSQIFQRAADLGLGIGAVNNMMRGLGITQSNEAANTKFHQMDMSLFQGSDGYRLDQYGHIVAGGGKVFVPDPNGGSGGSWQPRTTASA
jgi:hypothetical protein